MRTPIPSASSLRTHHFDPFLEITHRLQLKISFVASSVNAEPFNVDFPIIITDFPPNTKTSDYVPPPPITLSVGDDVSCVDLDLPEYTPRYEGNIP